MPDILEQSATIKTNALNAAYGLRAIFQAFCGLHSSSDTRNHSGRQLGDLKQLRESRGRDAA